MSSTEDITMAPVSDLPMAVIAQGVCSSGKTLKTLTSTSTIISTLPKGTMTSHLLATATIEKGFSETIRTVFIQTYYIGYTRMTTGYSPVTITTCVPASTRTSAPSLTTPATASPTSIVAGSAAVTGAAAPSEPDNSRTVIIAATVGGAVGALLLVVCFYLYRRYLRRHQSPRIAHLRISRPFNNSELIDMPYSPKATFSEAVTDLASVTMKDYVGSFPSISQRHLPQTVEHEALHADSERSGTPVTRWSEIIRSGKPIDAIPTSDLFTDTHNSLPSSDVSKLPAPGARFRASYQSRGSSAFLPPNGSQRNIYVPGSPREHELSILSPQPRSPIYPERVSSPSIYSDHTIAPTSQMPPWNPETSRAVSPSVYSRPASEYLERTPSRTAVWNETIRRLEDLHEDVPADLAVDPYAGGQNAAVMIDGEKRLEVSGEEGLRRRSPATKQDKEDDDGDYETVMYESDAESRIERQREREIWEMKGGGNGDIRESTFSIDAVLRKIANEPPRTREKGS